MKHVVLRHFRFIKERNLTWILLLYILCNLAHLLSLIFKGKKNKSTNVLQNNRNNLKLVVDTVSKFPSDLCWELFIQTTYTWVSLVLGKTLWLKVQVAKLHSTESNTCQMVSCGTSKQILCNCCPKNDMIYPGVKRSIVGDLPETCSRNLQEAVEMHGWTRNGLTTHRQFWGMCVRELSWWIMLSGRSPTKKLIDWREGLLNVR